MPRYQLPRVPWKEKAGRKTVTIQNGSDQTMEFSFDLEESGTPDLELYVFPPKTQMQVPARVAWYCLGDPFQRPGSVNRPLDNGTDQTWNNECRRLQEMFSARVWDPMHNNGPGHMMGLTVPNKTGVWQAILDGKIRCPELDTRRRGYYNGSDLRRPSHLATDALVEGEYDVRRQSAQASRHLVASTPFDDDENETTVRPMATSGATA